MTIYPWYSEVTEGDESIEQGDLVFSLLIHEVQDYTHGNEESPNVEQLALDCIVASQSCDLVAGREKIETVLLFPFLSWSNFDKDRKQQNLLPDFTPDKLFERIKNGQINYLHLLNSPINHSLNEPIVVNLRLSYSISVKYLRKFIKMQNRKRLRLMPPYREHLSQAVARFFMRVGLPSDIPSYKELKNNGMRS